MDANVTAKSQTYEQPRTVRRRLKAMGLDVETLTTAALRAATARFACTDFHPPSAPGFFMFAEAVRALRELLCPPPQGWEQNNDSNFCTVVSPDGRIAIAVAGGDDATGDPVRTPSTQHPKGPLTLAAVEMNQTSFAFAAPAQRNLDGSQPWFLLISVTEAEVRAELSLPETMSAAGWITSWKTRLLLPPIPIDSVPAGSGSDEDSGDVIDFDVPKRK